MSAYKFIAENVSRPQAVKLVHKLEGYGFEVEHADMDPMFTNVMIMIVTCNTAKSKQVRDHIWEENCGMSCDIIELSDKEFEEYL